ncbi:MAG: AAA family ATPase [Acidobacteriota bacterium]
MSREYLTSLPVWASELGRRYLSRTISQFVLYGNVRDSFALQRAKEVTDVSLREWLSESLFGERDHVLFYDRSAGLSFANAAQGEDFRGALSGYDAFHGTEHERHLDRDPATCLRVIESYLKVRLNQGRSLALILDYAESIAPAGELSGLSAEDRDVVVTLHRWAHDPSFLRGDVTIVLIAENLAEIHPTLLASPQVAALEIPPPDQGSRLAALERLMPTKERKKLSSLGLDALSELTAGLKLGQLQHLVAEAQHDGNPIDMSSLAERKKALIESECHGLLEFIESKNDLSAVAGHGAAKARLKQAADAIERGRTDVLPMGYLFSGPVGTGKSYLAKCFAGEIGVPCVLLKNFRSQWQGQTEANLERILTVLKALSPVLVVIDEADAYLGDRDSSGDSGVGSRVFSRIAAFMGDVELRGKVIWALLTCRPDLLPVDLKRQGRAEEHLSLFHPETDEDLDELYRALAKKVGLQTSVKKLTPCLPDGRRFSGADIEAGLVRVKFKAATEDRERVTKKDLTEIFADFLPATDPLAIELQTLAAVLECTSRALVPEEYREVSSSELASRLIELKALVDGSV